MGEQRRPFGPFAKLRAAHCLVHRLTPRLSCFFLISLDPHRTGGPQRRVDLVRRAVDIRNLRTCDRSCIPRSQIRHIRDSRISAPLGVASAMRPRTANTSRNWHGRNVVSVPCAQPSIYGNLRTCDRSLVPLAREIMIYVTHVCQHASENGSAIKTQDSVTMYECGRAKLAFPSQLIYVNHGYGRLWIPYMIANPRGVL
jgi:hypothetical protein